ncbi:hypothetical protein EIP91_009800 [Steccherinum ochraceum]|uniref:Uncharacterized protein n=1 Tax=Steccherinum ochraceum TaxID=92696 RepID=A0A4R0RME7_9APHY|nr:hypothetical protein EIP91_009800 [Steccherinum ochraceum]
MFQVASRPAAPFSDMQTYNHHQHAPTPVLNLPSSLKRPAFKEIVRSNLTKVDPNIPNYPLEFIKHHLKSRASEMRRALSLMSIMSSLPKSHLPPFLDVPLMPSSNPPETNDFPTHLLAVSANKTPASSPNTPTAASFASQMSGASAFVSLYPTNALVLATHCTQLPPFPIQRSEDETAASMRLPIIPVTVPHGETFPALHQFLHDKRSDKLLSFLLPSLSARFPRPSSSSSSSSRGSQEIPLYVSAFSSDHVVRFAQELISAAYAATGPQGAASGLMAHTKIIQGLWQNTCSLGIHDAELWATMDFAYAIILSALTGLATRERY